MNTQSNWEPTRENLMRRKIEFPQIIIDIANNNPVVAKMVEAYAHGQLCTKEEAYCQIIKELSKTREQLVRQMVDEKMMASHLSIMVPNTAPRETK